MLPSTTQRIINDAEGCYLGPVGAGSRLLETRKELMKRDNEDLRAKCGEGSR